MIGIRNLGFSVWLIVSASVCMIACGDDADDTNGTTDGGGGSRDRDSGSQSGRDASTGGGGGSGGSTSQRDASTGNRDSGPEIDEDGGASEPCGAVVCEAPMCCADPFVSTCGVALGRACLMPPENDPEADPRCPSISIMGIFTLRSCCTEDNQCGIDASTFGSGCITYEQAEMGAMNMGAGGFIDWPEPQACE